ncbi:hypothetical protein ACQR09_31590 [Bradyrhizobium oligotrophicum]|uniref:hypothetical protein n=1 Tax=Bradyrhizobium oligotrophicum TaxID=44255 RepID=UPI003EBD07B7
MLDATFTDTSLPDPELEAIAAIPNLRSRAIALTRYPGLDPRNTTVTTMAAVLTEDLIGEWGKMLHHRLAFLASLDSKSLEKLQKKLRKAPVSPLNIWFDFADDQAPVVMTTTAAADVQHAAIEELV